MADNYKHTPIELTDSAKKRIKKKKIKLSGGAGKAQTVLAGRKAQLDAQINGATTVKYKATRSK